MKRLLAGGARRLATLLVTLFIVSFVTFSLTTFLPGDPARQLLGGDVDLPQELIDEVRAELRLDEPIHVRYAHWVSGVVRGDFGDSYVTTQAVSKQIWSRLPVTFELAVVSIVLAVGLAVPLAAVSAYRAGGFFDRLITTGSFILLSTASFIMGIVLIYVFAVRLQWLPAVGWTPLTESVTGNLKSVILPALSLALPLSAIQARLLRSEIVTSLQQDYIVLAGAKGLRVRRILFRHALRPALLPLITIAGLHFGYLLGGAIVIESIFALPGLGLLVIQAISQRDLIMVQGATLVIATGYVVVNQAVDLLYGVIDPRVRGRAADV